MEAGKASLNQESSKTRRVPYRARSPKKTLFYQVISEHFPKFLSTGDAGDETSIAKLPDYVTAEFDAYLKCGILEHGFVKMSCEDCSATLLVPLSCKKRGFCPSCIGKRMNEGAAFFVTNVIPQVSVRQWVLSFPMPARFWMARNPRLMSSLLNIFMRAVHRYYKNSFLKNSGINHREYKIQTGSLTVIQRFGGALNLNIHFHTLFLDGAYISKVETPNEAPIFVANNPLQTEEVEIVLKTIQKRMVRHLIKRGLLSKYENEHVTDLNEELTLLDSLQGSSVLGRIGTGANQGKKVRRIGSFGFESESAFKSGPLAATLAGFSLHAATFIKAEKRDRLETLCRYLLRPPVSEKRLERRNNGDVILRLKSEWSDGTRAIELTPHEFIEKLIAIIPQPRIHGVRFHGILAPSAEDRKKVVPVVLTQPPQGELFECHQKKPKTKKSSWAELLKRTFQIDLSQCLVCGGVVRFQKAVLRKSEIMEILTLSNLSPTPE
jgi:hypothetical protein